MYNKKSSYPHNTPRHCAVMLSSEDDHVRSHQSKVVGSLVTNNMWDGGCRYVKFLLFIGQGGWGPGCGEDIEIHTRTNLGLL